MITPASIRRRRTLAALALAAAGLLPTACSAPGPASETAAPDPGTGHLHGLGVDPADNAVYAAGHLGVFRLSGGTAERVADRYQDTMGFTVTGPHTFLASGHPSPADPELRSPHLGLVRSTDAGWTWQKVSAEGEADFHALVRAGSALYGYDSQSGRVWAGADDGRSWDKHARLPLLDLAAHNSRPQQVWAATGTGLLRGDHGAATFQPVTGAPAAVAVEENARERDGAGSPR
ncbi:hypothetical protein [Streptomyces sp. MN13]